MNRRKFLGATALVASLAALSACSATTAAAMDAQVLADASGAVNGLSAIVPNIALAAPTVVTPAVAASLEGILVLAKGLVAGLSANTPAPTAASTMQVVASYLNQVVDALAGVAPAAAAAFPVLAPFVIPLEAAAALLPGIEAFVVSVIPTATVSTKVAAVGGMTATEARAVLGVPVVR